MPVMQVQRIDNEQMRFVPNDESVDITDTSFRGSVNALAGFPPGPALVRVWVNGVPSAARFLAGDDTIFASGFEALPSP